MDVSELTLQEKGFYRELIDECFLKSSSKIELNERTFCRLHGINSRTFTKVLRKLHESSLIVLENIEGTIISVPSTSKRLGVVEQSSNGGKAKALSIEKKSAKEKEKSNTKEKENIIDDRKLKFASTLTPFVDKYGKEMIREFYEYWTEPNKSNTKFKQELEQTWSLDRRLETWSGNQGKFGSTDKPKRTKPPTYGY